MQFPALKLVLFITSASASRFLIPSAPYPLPKQVQEHYITLNLTHFNVSDQRSFENRYFENCQFHVAEGPVFIVQEGWDSTVPLITGGPIYEIAKEKGAAMVSLELRYTGNSYPFKHLSTNNLKWNTIPNQIEDLSDFINFCKKKFNTSSIFLFGVSDAAANVARHRDLYPKLSSGAWISSPTIQAEVAVPQLVEEARNNFRRAGGESCYDKLEKSFSTIEVILWANQSHHIERAFNTCATLDNPKDVQVLYHRVFEVLIAMSLEPDYYIVQQCKLLERVWNPVEALAAITKIYLSPKNCLDVSYEHFVKNLQNETPDNDDRARWHFQCFNSAQFPTVEFKTQVSGPLSVQFFIDLCRDTFNRNLTLESMQKTVDLINESYGGSEADVDNALITWGEFDPYRSLGIDKQYSTSAPVVPIAGAKHGNDLLWFKYKGNENVDEIKTLFGAMIDMWMPHGKKDIAA